MHPDPTQSNHPDLRAPAVPPRMRLLDQVRARIRVKHYSIRTEEAHVDWIKRYIRFHDKRHPSELSAAHVERFMSYLATERDVAASTQNQARGAQLFLYKEMLATELPLPAAYVAAASSRGLQHRSGPRRAGR